MTATLGVGMSQGLSKMSARGAGASVNVWAEFAVLLAALSYALSAIFARRMPAFGLKPIDVAAGQATAATVFLVPLALIFDKPWMLPTPSAAVMASVLAIAAFST